MSGLCGKVSAMPRDPANREPRKGSAAEIALEVSRLQARLLEKLEEEMRGADGQEYLRAAQGLAKAFGAVTAAAIDPLSNAEGGSLAVPGLDPSPGLEPSPTSDPSPAPDPAPAFDRRAATRDPRLPPTKPGQTPPPEPGRQLPDATRGQGLQMPPLYRSHEMRRRLAQLIETYKRYGHPFGLAVFDVDGPELREDDGSAETVRTVLGVALHDSVRLIDESFRLEEDGLCVLAPYQDTVGGVQMAERLLDKLEGLEAVGGLRIAVTAGVVACPEHGVEAKQLLEGADEAMWRARAVGEPVGVGALQAR
jgi:diguanylate cyclase (GGDEF)-like protein